MVVLYHPYLRNFKNYTSMVTEKYPLLPSKLNEYFFMVSQEENKPVKKALISAKSTWTYKVYFHKSPGGFSKFSGASIWPTTYGYITSDFGLL